MARNQGATNCAQNDDEGIANGNSIRYWQIMKALPNVSEDFHIPSVLAEIDSFSFINAYTNCGHSDRLMGSVLCHKMEVTYDGTFIRVNSWQAEKR